MFDLGTKDLLIIAVILIVLFGAKKIPDLTKGVADAIRHLRNAFKDEPVQTAQSKPASDSKKN